MSGLLDKATAAKEAEPVEAVKVEPAPVPRKSKEASKGLMAASTPATSDGSPMDYLQQAGWGIIVLAGILSLRGGELGLAIVSVVALIGVLCLVQFERMKPELSTVKIGVSVVLAIIIALGPYAALAIIPADSSMALTQIEVDQDSDELTFYVRGSFDSSSVTITSEGTELWAGSESLSNDFAKFRVPISEFFEGNAQNNMGDSIKVYEINVEADDGQTQTRTITPSLLNREVLNSGAKITMVTKTETSGTTTETSVDGLIIESIVGLFDPSEEAEDGGEHSMSTVNNYLPVFSDYTIQLKVMKGGSQKWQSPVITADGTDTTWVSAVSGSKSGSSDRWMGIAGTGYDADTGMIEILKEEDFYDSSGCYTFQVIVVNQYFTGDSSTQVSSSAWELDFSNTDGEMTACS